MAYHLPGCNEVIDVDTTSIWSKGNKAKGDTILLKGRIWLCQLSCMVQAGTFQRLYCALRTHCSKVACVVIRQTQHIKARIHQVMHISNGTSENVTHFRVATGLRSTALVEQ